MIKLEHVTKKYEDKTALCGINLILPDTGFVVIKGKNGAGKSTLLNLLGAIDTQTEGSIEVNGTFLEKLNQRGLSKYREQNISFIFQNGNLFPNMTVQENIELVAQKKRIDAVAKLLNIEHIMNKKAKDISGGESARTEIARALIKETKIILADEPTAALDAEMREEIFKILKHLSKTRLVVMITHDVNHYERYADIVLTLENGHLITLDKKTAFESKNEIDPFKNHFHPISFAFKNLFSNHKKIKVSCLSLILILFFVLTTLTLSRLDFSKMHRDTLIAEKFDIIDFKSYTKDGEYIVYGGEFLKKDIDYIKSKLPSDMLLKTKWTYATDNSIPSIFLAPNTRDDSYYYPSFVEPFFENVGSLKQVDYGSLPRTKNEAAISTYLADLIIEKGAYDREEKQIYKPESYEQLLSDKKQLYLGNIPIIITGIYSFDEPYDEFKNNRAKWISYVERYAYDIYITSELEASLPKKLSSEYSVTLNETIPISSKLEIFEGEMPTATGEILNTLNDDEIIISKEILYDLGYDLIDYIDREVTLTLNKNDERIFEKNFKIRGVSTDDHSYIREETIEPFLSTYEKKYTKVFIENLNTKQIKSITKNFLIDKGFYRLYTPFSGEYLNLASTIKTISVVFKGISIIFIIVGLLLLYNYIKNSIASHKRDIAILKCFGITDRTIFYTFVLESITISISSYCMAIILFLIARVFVNYSMTKMIGFDINIIPIDLIVIIVLFMAMILIPLLIAFTGMSKIKKTTPMQIFQKESL